MSEQLEKAIDLALRMHTGQVDKAGKPYILHLLRVMLAVEPFGEEHMIVGVLHDLIEDTGFPRMYLQPRGFSAQVIEAIDAITHYKGEKTYEEYLERVAANPIALVVKSFDIHDNLSRLRQIQDEAVRRRLADKYLRALGALPTIELPSPSMFGGVPRETKDV